MWLGLYAFAFGAGFVGAAIYICIVEQPARLALSTRSMIQEWVRSNRRGTVLSSALAVVSAILAYIQFRIDGDVRWIIGGTTILSSWPYAYFVMVPLNVWLYVIPPRRAPTLRKLMRDWGLLEWGHALIGFAGCCVLAWVLEQPA
jgi:Domain of unknown function (DUF1772)